MTDTCWMSQNALLSCRLEYSVRSIFLANPAKISIFVESYEIYYAEKVPELLVLINQYYLRIKLLLNKDFHYHLYHPMNLLWFMLKKTIFRRNAGLFFHLRIIAA